MLDTFQQVSHHGLGGRDVTILVCMKKAGITKLVTHDQDFKKITNIEIIDPINWMIAWLNLSDISQFSSEGGGTIFFFKKY